MRSFTPAIWFATAALAGITACAVQAAEREGNAHTPCVDDAMIVFDASGSMSPATAGGYGSETAGTLEVLPSITRMRRVGLITLSSLLS